MKTNETSIFCGQRVTWRSRPRGGYGQMVPVAAVVEAIGRRVTIRVARRIGGQWRTERKQVKRENLEPRDERVPAVDG